jgi:predicted metal-binding protein
MTTLYVCETCRHSDTAQEDEQGRRGGVVLAEQIERRLDPERDAGLEVRRIRCLMACSRHCVVHLRAAGKMGYVIGDMPPAATSADTLLDYARQYQRSETGVVAYSSWPEGIKGHFIARVPPLEQP